MSTEPKPWMVNGVPVNPLKVHTEGGLVSMQLSDGTIRTETVASLRRQAGPRSPQWLQDMITATEKSNADLGLQMINDSIARTRRAFTPQSIAEAYGELDELRADNARLQRQIDHFNRTHGDCGAELHDLREENAELRTRIQELEGVEQYHGKVARS